MTEFLVRRFVKDYGDVERVSVRTAYGVLSSVVGILCNVALFLVKLAAGMGLHSVSVLADAFNNLSDAGSSVISFVGVKMAEKPADEDHPFGHGRIEYIAALIVSFLVLEVGFSFLKDSVGKIREPEALYFQPGLLLLLLLSIGVKLWLGFFNRKLGEKIDSKVLKAVFTDSMGDVMTTAATIVSMVFFRFTGINIDGVIGAGVALVVMWAGIGIAKDTLAPLIGEAIDPEIYHKIKDFVEQYDGIIGTHDLIVHNYGPNRSMASIHAEVPSHVDIERSHEIIDRVERDAVERLGVFLVVHMDPIDTDNAEAREVRERVEAALGEVDAQCTLHDFRMVNGEKRVNLIFDLVVPFSYGEERQREIKEALCDKMDALDKRYQCVITVEHAYVAEESAGK
ncbi:MAG: cation transporter [Ruminococcus sp.]|nr:cation transporter [Ruminococcus sp.]